MPLTNEELETLSAVLLLVGFLPYIIAILRKKTRPTRATWIAWAVADSLLAYALYQKGELSGQMIGACIGVGIVLLLSIWRGRPGWKLGDKICLGGTLAGLAVMLLLPEGDSHIYIMAAAMFVAGVPTVFTVIEDYREEDLISWIFWAASCVPALMALGPFEEWTPVGSAQELSFALLDIPMVALLLVLRLWVYMGWKALPVKIGEDAPPDDDLDDDQDDLVPGMQPTQS